MKDTTNKTLRPWEDDKESYRQLWYDGNEDEGFWISVYESRAGDGQFIVAYRGERMKFSIWKEFTGGDKAMAWADMWLRIAQSKAN